MLAAVYYGINDLRLEEVEDPSIANDEALVKVRVASICGTDLRILASGHFKIPPGTKRILGHEFSGEVIELGPEVKNLKLGMRISVAPNIGCGVCDECLRGFNNLCPDYQAFGINIDGAFAQYVRIPGAAIRQGNVMPIPDVISDEVAALCEPFSCCYHGSLACHITPNDTVLIIGAGPIGLMHIALARLSGALKVMVSEIIEERVAQAKHFGADCVLNPVKEDLVSRVKEETNGKGADVVIVTVASPEVQEQALEVAARHGRINIFAGLPKEREEAHFHSNLIHYKELVVTGTTGSSTYDYRRAMNILTSGRVDLSPLISEKFKLKDVLQAFQFAASRKAFKVIITP